LALLGLVPANQIAELQDHGIVDAAKDIQFKSPAALP
jgi:hypothetical protein